MSPDNMTWEQISTLSHVAGNPILQFHSITQDVPDDYLRPSAQDFQIPSLKHRFWGREVNQPIGSPVMTPTTEIFEQRFERPLLPPRPANCTWSRSSEEMKYDRNRGAREASVAPTTPLSSLCEDQSTEHTETSHQGSSTKVVA